MKKLVDALDVIRTKLIEVVTSTQCGSGKQFEVDGSDASWNASLMKNS